MHRFHVPQCTILLEIYTCVFLLQNDALWNICQMHWGICEMGLVMLSIKTSTCYVPYQLTCHNSGYPVSKSYMGSCARIGPLAHQRPTGWGRLSISEKGHFTLSPSYLQRYIKICVWISNRAHYLRCDVITHPHPNFNEVWAWISMYIPLFYVALITCPCPNPNADIVHYNDVMGVMASQITSIATVYSTVYSRRRSKKISKHRVTGLCEGKSPGTGEFRARMASNAENSSIWWRLHVIFVSKRVNRIMFVGCYSLFVTRSFSLTQ